MFLAFLLFVFDDWFQEGDKRFLVFANKLHDGGAVFDIESVLLFFSELDVVFTDAVTHKGG